MLVEWTSCLQGHRGCQLNWSDFAAVVYELPGRASPEYCLVYEQLVGGAKWLAVPSWFYSSRWSSGTGVLVSWVEWAWAWSSGMPRGAGVIILALVVLEQVYGELREQGHSPNWPVPEVTILGSIRGTG